MSAHYTPQEKRFIRDNYMTMEYSAIAAELGRTKKAIQATIIRMRLPHKLRYSVEEPPITGPRLWTDSDKQYILANYGRKTAKQLAFDLNRSKGSIEQRIFKLGLGKYNTKKRRKVNVVIVKEQRPVVHRVPHEPELPTKSIPITRPPAIYSNKGGYLETLNKYA